MAQSFWHFFVIRTNAIRSHFVHCLHSSLVCLYLVSLLCTALFLIACVYPLDDLQLLLTAQHDFPLLNVWESESPISNLLSSKDVSLTFLACKWLWFCRPFWHTTQLTVNFVWDSRHFRGYLMWQIQVWYILNPVLHWVVNIEGT